MAFRLLRPGKTPIVHEPIEEKPVKAFARGAAESFTGTHGDILSQIPGYGKTEQETQQPTLITKLLNLVLKPPPGFSSRPTSQKASELLEKAGIKKEERTKTEQGLGRFGRGFGSSAALTGNIPLSLSTAFTGTGAAELAKEAGANPTVQNIAEFLFSLRGRPNAPKATSNAIRQPRSVEKGIAPSTAGTITTERLNQQLARVGQEASEIAKTIGEKHPTFQKVSKAIDSGFPIQEKFNKAFTDLEEIAKHYNPPVNNRSLDNFLSKEGQKYANTGAQTEIGRFVTDQINGWQRSGKAQLYNDFRRYRLNNVKIREILEALPPGQKVGGLEREKINFLTRMNDSIRESFEHTFSANRPALPGQTGNQSNQWLNAFNETNRGYTAYNNTQLAKKIIDPIMHQNVTDKQLNAFLKNGKNWQDLERFMGKKEAGELHQLVEDLSKARNALQSFNQKDIGSEAVKHALGTLIPGVGKFTALFSLPKLWQWARGRYNSSPSFQGNFHELTEALIEKNIPAIQKAAEKIKEEEKEKKPKFRLIRNK